MSAFTRCSFTVIKMIVMVCYLVYFSLPTSHMIALVTAIGCDFLTQPAVVAVVATKSSPVYSVLDICSSVVYVVVVVIGLVGDSRLPCNHVAVAYRVVTLLVVVMMSGRRMMIEGGYNGGVVRGILRYIVVMLFVVLMVVSSLSVSECILHYNNPYFLPVSFCVLLSYGVTTALSPSVWVVIGVGVSFVVEVGSVVYSMIASDNSTVSVVHLLLLGALLLDSLETVVRKKYEEEREKGEEKEGKEEKDVSEGY